MIKDAPIGATLIFQGVGLGRTDSHVTAKIFLMDG